MTVHYSERLPSSYVPGSSQESDLPDGYVPDNLWEVTKALAELQERVRVLEEAMASEEN